MVLLFNTCSIAITFALLVELIVHPKGRTIRKLMGGGGGGRSTKKIFAQGKIK